VCDAPIAYEHRGASANSHRRLNPQQSRILQTATWGIATADDVDAFDFRWDRAGRSSKHFPFD
jgi:hypothetical protein